jgi:lysosomal acid lipase/cholesteryl ester hydrolase
LLSDNGYDVWLGNTRGNDYGLHHKKLKVESKEFWNFSWHEIGQFDLPTMIDFVLFKTKKPKLFYVGHSQGTTVLFVLMSLRPEYNEKVFQAHFLAPAVFFRQNSNWMYRVVANDYEVL